MKPTSSSSVSGGAFGRTNVLPACLGDDDVSPGGRPNSRNCPRSSVCRPRRCAGAGGRRRIEQRVDLHARHGLAVLVGDAAGDHRPAWQRDRRLVERLPLAIRTIACRNPRRPCRPLRAERDAEIGRLVLPAGRLDAIGPRGQPGELEASLGIADRFPGRPPIGPSSGPRPFGAVTVRGVWGVVSCRIAPAARGAAPGPA